MLKGKKEKGGWGGGREHGHIGTSIGCEDMPQRCMQLEELNFVTEKLIGQLKIQKKKLLLERNSPHESAFVTHPAAAMTKQVDMR